MSSHARKGRKISRRACDLCRDRKVQCVFDAEDAQRCQKCHQINVPCTFLTQRRPRGPPNRRVQEAQRKTLLSPELPSPGYSEHAHDNVSSVSLPLPIGQLAIEHLVPRPTFQALITEFLERVYPLLPLVHVPEFTAKFEACDYDKDPRFFRLCIAICAVTMASIPRQIETYACDVYQNAGQLVERAAHIILTCRLSSDMSWQQKPSISDMIVSVLLSMAAHYAEWANVGWAYASEATHSFRGLRLYSKSAYVSLDPVDTELSKRAFWLLYIMQVHDRLSRTTPHTSLSYDPLETDWDFMFPNEVSDEDLHRNEVFPLNAATNHDHRPAISGFLGLVKIFVCVAEVLCQDFPDQVLVHAMTSGSFISRLLPLASPKGSRSASRREALLSVVTRLQYILKDLPDELRLSSRRSSPVSQATLEDEGLSLRDRQFAVMRVNIHVTSLYLQSTLLDICLETLTGSSARAAPASVADTVNENTFGFKDGQEARTGAELWELRQNLAQELLDVLHRSTSKTLESNGLSMIVKIREIAASLLVGDVDHYPLTDVESRSQQYVAQFADILARLDYLSKAKQGVTVG